MYLELFEQKYFLVKKVINFDGGFFVDNWLVGTIWGVKIKNS